MVKSRYIGDGHPTFNRNPYNGYINPYYWVDEFIPYYMEIMGVDRPWHTCQINKLSSQNQLSRKKTLLLSIESWLVNRDPYFMVYYNPHITGARISSPTNPLNNQGPFFHCSNDVIQQSSDSMTRQVLK